MVILKLYYRVIKALIKKRYQLCYLTINSSGPGFYKEMIIVFILKCFCRKIVYHYHNKGVREGSKKIFNNLLYKIQFKNSTVILLSPKLFFDVAKFLKPTQVYYCNNGIAGINFPISRISEEQVKVRLLFVSNMFIAKGVYVLLDACKVLFKNKIPFVCNFIGEWTSEICEDDFIKRYAENGIAENVKAHGPKFNNEKINYFLNSDIFVFPTAYANEVFPLVILEAMQFNLPIISTNEGAITDIIIDGCNGFIIPKNDPVALANKIIELINNKSLRNEMGIKGRQRFEELYTLPIFEQNFKSTLDKVMEGFKK